MRGKGIAHVIWFAAGLGLGIAAGILLAPQSGAVTRDTLGRKAEQAGTRFADSGREYIERGRYLYERGRQLADEAAELFEEGRRFVENTRREEGNAT